LSSNTSIYFHGGVHEIGGNKFLIEDGDTKIFLDFGMQMGMFNQFYAEFVNRYESKTAEGEYGTHGSPKYELTEVFHNLEVRNKDEDSKLD